MLDIVRMDKINPGLLIAFPLPFIFPRDCFCFMFFLPGEFVYILRARNVHCGPVVCSAENELKGGESNNQLLQRLGRLSVTGRTKMKFYCHVISYSACVREDPYLGQDVLALLLIKCIYQLLCFSGNFTAKCHIEDHRLKGVTKSLYLEREAEGLMLLHFDYASLPFLLIFLIFVRRNNLCFQRCTLSCISTFWKYVVSSQSGKSPQGGKENVKTTENLVDLITFLTASNRGCLIFQYKIRTKADKDIFTSVKVTYV